MKFGLTRFFVYLTLSNSKYMFFFLFPLQIKNHVNGPNGYGYHRTRIHRKKNYVTKYSVNFWRKNPFIASLVKTHHNMLYKTRRFLSNVKNGINSGISRISMKSNQVRRSFVQIYIKLHSDDIHLLYHFSSQLSSFGSNPYQLEKISFPNE